MSRLPLFFLLVFLLLSLPLACYLDPSSQCTQEADCSGSRRCQDGQCLCLANQTLCKDRCSNVLTDSSNCGVCGKVCELGVPCVGGFCSIGPTCRAPFTTCDSLCVDLSTDVNHCGACKAACLRGQICHERACFSSCPSPTTLCSGLCFDLKNDVRHCGKCGISCASGEHCSHGLCCPVGQEACDFGGLMCLPPIVCNP